MAARHDKCSRCGRFSSLTARVAGGLFYAAGLRWLCARCWAAVDSLERRPRGVVEKSVTIILGQH